MSSTPSYSIVIPAYKEVLNIRPLLTRLRAAFSSPASPIPLSAVEVLIVDDNSRDGSVELVHELQKEGFPVRIVVRTDERGLSSAVVRGFREARGEAMVCMDCDLQHPPEMVPTMLSSLSSRTPFTLGTRYGPGVAMDDSWPLYRRIISAGARYMALPLTTVSDPMSGFFGIRKEEFSKARSLNSDGFKIALDLLLKAQIPASGVAEIPFSFGVRAEGESKLSGKVMVKYVEQLAELYWWKFGPLLIVLALFLLFALVALFLLVTGREFGTWH